MQNKKIYEMINMKDSCAVITGAAGYIGRAIANAYSELGSSLILVDKDLPKLIDLAEQLTATSGVNVSYQAIDLEESKQCQILIEWIKLDNELPNILVNGAAYVGSANLEGWAEGFEGQSVELWDRVLRVNLAAPFELCQGLAPIMRNSKKSGLSIINISSIYAKLGPDWRMYENTSMSNPAAYSASKGGLNQLTNWLSTSLAPEIRVNAISPGGIYRGQDKNFLKEYLYRTPLNRMAIEEDIIGAAVYFATDLSRYVTGQNLVVDGGFSVW